MKKMRFTALFMGIVTLGLVLNSCYPNGPEFVDELDIVATEYDTDFNFSAVRTYIMPDTIVRVDDPDNPSNPILTPQDDQEILDLIAQNMANFGYVRVPDTLNAESDVVLLVSSVSQDNWVIWWDYWGWWGGWPPYGPGWGWWYPWYPGGGWSGYSYTTGSLFVQMVDEDGNSPIEDTVPTHWIGIVNGLLQGSRENIKSRVEDGVDQMFVQSAEYLDNN